MNTLELNGTSLNIRDIYLAAKEKPSQQQFSIATSAQKKMKASRDFVLKKLKDNKPIYGINTGFGALSNVQVSNDDLEELQYNIIRSHCTGVGKAFSREITRAIMILRANCLVSGHSGLNPELVDLMVEFLNQDINPVIPMKGSVGASGDLAPLSHLALALIGEGEVFYCGEVRESSEVIAELNLKKVTLGPKDGLALINGTAVMGALGAIALGKAIRLVKLADVAAAITNEAVRGTASAYDPLISQLKPHQGQLDVSTNLMRVLQNSQIRDSHKDCGKVQDPYSLRCVPQVHGACRQTLYHVIEVFQTEINSVTDNPLIFPDEDIILSGGNFHGEAVALAMDYLAMGMAELCNISERRIEKMMNPVFSDLPHFLTENPGLNSGLMIAHVTAAALTSENKVHCHPASVDSVPTSTDKEDHVSMGVTSGNKLQEVIKNTQWCLAIEFLCCTQALDLLAPLKSSKAIQIVYEVIRQHVPKITKDRVLYKDIKKITRLIDDNIIIDAIEKEIGALK